jgi:hypothetical protein
MPAFRHLHVAHELELWYILQNHANFHIVAWRLRIVT